MIHFLFLLTINMAYSQNSMPTSQIEFHHPIITKKLFAQFYYNPLKKAFCENEDNMFAQCFDFKKSKSKTCTQSFKQSYQKCTGNITSNSINYYHNESALLEQMGSCIGENIYQTEKKYFKKASPQCIQRSAWF